MPATRMAAATAAALMLLTGPLAVSPAFAQPASTPATARPNSEPPPLPPNAPLPNAGKPGPDVPYKRNNKLCITSETKGLGIVGMPWGQIQLRLDEAHRFATGRGINIAVIDTGVNRHPLLGNRVTGLGDYVGSGPENKDGTDDCDGHGTEVAGVAAAGRAEGADFIGAAPEANILAIRQTSDRFEWEGNATQPKRASAGKVGTLAQAIMVAANAGAHVINISLTNCGSVARGFSADDQSLQAAIRYAVDVKNAVVVTAAGNLGDENSGCTPQNDKQDPKDVNVVASPPWFAEDVLSVASMSKDGKVSEFSVWGPWVSIAAPGEEITSIDPKGRGLTNANMDPANERLTSIRGTSFASPYVAGVAALVRERYSNLTARQVMARLKATAQHPGNPGGRDNKAGHGMVNPVAALTAVLPSEQANAKPPTLEPIFTTVNPPVSKNWTPMIVALSGTGIGVGLLLLTLFVIHTMNRTRPRRTT